MTDNDPALVFVSAQIIDVQMVRGLLESEGIQAFVFDDNIVRLNPFYAQAVSGIKLFVRSKDVNAASEILRDHLGVKGDAPFSGTLAPINKSTMLDRVQEPMFDGELDAAAQQAAPPTLNRRAMIRLSPSDWVLGIFVAAIALALVHAAFNW